MEVGYGLEGTLTDLEAAEFGRAGVPYYQSGDVAGGVRLVVQGLAARLEGLPGARRASAPGPRDPLQDPVVWIVAIFIVWFILQTLAGRRTLGRRAGYRGGYWGGGGWGGGGGGGFSGGGGSSGGGGASGGWR